MERVLSEPWLTRNGIRSPEEQMVVKEACRIHDQEVRACLNQTQAQA